MLEKIRNMNFGWILLLVGITVIASGMSMKEGKAGEYTLTCFNKGCIYIQGISNIVIGILILIFGTYSIAKK
jgi:tellurite resistance protein TehA-like permease